MLGLRYFFCAAHPTHFVSSSGISRLQSFTKPKGTTHHSLSHIYKGVESPTYLLVYNLYKFEQIY